MKEIENKITELEKADTKDYYRYYDLIKEVIDRKPVQGFSRDDYKKRDRIEDAMASRDDEVLKFEDNDFSELQRLTGEMTWYIRHKDISTFIDLIEAT